MATWIIAGVIGLLVILVVLFAGVIEMASQLNKDDWG